MAARWGIAPVLTLFLAVLLAGCLDPPGPPPPPPPPPNTGALLSEAHVVEDLRLSLEHTYGNLRARGWALAVPYMLHGQERGAVYLGSNVSWRADASFNVREQPPVPTDLFVQAPAGTWAQVRRDQGWRSATAADLSRLGLDNTTAAVLRAARWVPAEDAATQEGQWVFNGTISGRLSPTEILLTTDVGPYVFQRNATGFLVVDKTAIINYKEAERTVSGASGGLFNVRVHDPVIASLDVSWADAKVDIRLRVPAFRVPDLVVERDPILKSIAVDYPGAGKVALVGATSDVVEDNLVELRNQNITLRMSP